jgi:ribonuclease P protein component
LSGPEGTLSPANPGTGFPPEARLLRHADFERVYKQGQRHFASHMTVFYLRRPEASNLRIGFTVSRKLGGAVQRNRMRRRLREAVRLQRQKATVGADVVINPKASLLRADFLELLQQVAAAFGVIQRKLSDQRKP